MFSTWKPRIEMQRGVMRLDRASNAALARVAAAYPETLAMGTGPHAFHNWRDCVALGMAARQVLAERNGRETL